jgi:hypothetical protein
MPWPRHRWWRGRVKAGLAHTKKLMEEKKYRTAAEMVLAEFPEAQRNKRGDYDKALSRVLLDEELQKLFFAQRVLGNPNATIELEHALRGSDDKRGGLFWSQKPALSGKDLLKMLGYCTFEKSEHRAPKASFTAERHVWLIRGERGSYNMGWWINPPTHVGASRRLIRYLPSSREMPHSLCYYFYSASRNPHAGYSQISQKSSVRFPPPHPTTLPTAPPITRRQNSAPGCRRTAPAPSENPGWFATAGASGL